jgi:hypothetical protein
LGCEWQPWWIGEVWFWIFALIASLLAVLLPALVAPSGRVLTGKLYFAMVVLFYCRNAYLSWSFKSTRGDFDNTVGLRDLIEIFTPLGLGLFGGFIAMMLIIRGQLEAITKRLN